MQTLIKEEVNTSIFESKEHYLAFRKAWSESVNNLSSISAFHHALYALLRNRDHRECFTPITNRNKLENGQSANDSQNMAENKLRYLARLARGFDHFDDEKKESFVKAYLWPFGDTVTTDMYLAAIREGGLS